MLKNLSKELATLLKSLEHNLETVYAGPPHGLTVYRVSATSDVNCRKRKFYRRTDG